MTAGDVFVRDADNRIAELEQQLAAEIEARKVEYNQSEDTICELEQRLEVEGAHSDSYRQQLAASKKENERLRRGINECNRFCPALEALEQQNDALREVAEEFCDRRDRGEVRSTYTYNRFKAALAQEGE